MKKKKAPPEKRIRISVEGYKGHWRAHFVIDQQGFSLSEVDTKREALWYCKCIRHALNKLKFKNDEVTI